MRIYTAEEATKFFRSYQVKCEEHEVEEWIKKTPTMERNKELDEWDMYAFSNWMECLGTAWEPGIDDPTKIERLMERIKELNEENNALKGEIFILESRLEKIPN